MVRLLGIVLALGLVAGPAAAQVFKPKGKKADVVEKKAEKKPAKKTTKTAAKKKSSSKKRSTVADRGRPDDLTPEPSSKNEDSDYVKITDDDDIE